MSASHSPSSHLPHPATLLINHLLYRLVEVEADAVRTAAAAKELEAVLLASLSVGVQDSPLTTIQ